MNKWLILAVLTAAQVLPAQNHTLSEAKIVEIAPFRYAALEMQGDYQQHQEAFPKLYQLAIAQNLGYSIQIFGIYLDDPAQVPVDQLRWELGFELSEGQTVSEPLVEKTWNHPLMATITYNGPFTDEMGSAMEALFTFVMSNGYAPAGPMMQKFVGMPSQNEQGLWVGTMESWLPVQK